jgi:hypothetical protein
MKRFSRIGILSLFLLGTLTAGSVQALGISIPSPSKVADQLEKRYNFDLQGLQEQAQNFNVADTKQTAPQVTLIFDPSDPRPGQRVTARTFPIYFGGPAEQLYYTWVLKRSGCDLDTTPSKEKEALCDEDNNKRITVEDWKIAAMGELVRNGFNNEGVSYANDGDSDGYRSRFGGDTKVNTPNHCYFHDNDSGEDYEIADTGNTNYTCPNGTEPVCVTADQVLEPSNIPASTGGNNAASTTFAVSDGGACFVAGSPACSADGKVSCSVGEARCIDRNVQDDCGTTLSSCSITTAAAAGPICRHLFPNAPGQTTGDGTFGADEERFWRTNPNDDSTAENGNKDEANLAGLGQTSFTWNYASGDQVGVAVEGTSLFPTKHDDSSYKILWAFSKNDCPLSLADGTGSYVEKVKNYQVTFPTANIDLNRCFEKNLVDPSQGGQATNLQLQMITSPENPVNDETSDQSGDRITAQALVDNGQKALSGQYFEWQVEISDNIQFNNALGTVADITEDLKNKNILPQAKGAALSSIAFDLNFTRDTRLAGRPFSDYLAGDAGYIRVSVKASENFSSGVVRKGKTNAVIAFTSTRAKIIAYKAATELSGTAMRVAVPGNEGIICQDTRIDRAVCRVLQNEIIAMKIDATNLKNFQWTINGVPLTCSPGTSANCSSEGTNEVNFFPVSGASGSSYSVGVTASDITTGKTISASRLFQVVDPSVAIMSADNATLSPKLLGEYRDISGSLGGCDNGICKNYSDKILEGQSGKVLKVKAVYIPSFLAKTSQTEWEVNGSPVTETNPGELTIDASTALPGRVVNVKLRGVTNQDDDIRRALADNWGISQIDSAETRFEAESQIEIVEAIDTVAATGIQKYLAAIGTYVPSALLYTFRMMLAGSLVLAAAAMALVFLPGEAPVRVRSRDRE